MNDLLQLMHDTMSPVASIKGAIEVLKTSNLSDEEKLKLYEGIFQSAEGLNSKLDSFYIDQKKKESEFFVGAKIGIEDSKGNDICNGDTVKFYYKGTYVNLKIIYVPDEGMFCTKWPDGYINKWPINGAKMQIIKVDENGKEIKA